MRNADARVCALFAGLPHLTLQGPDAHVLLVKLLLLESDPIHQLVDAFVLSLQHQLTEKK